MTATQPSDSRRRWFILALIGLAQLMVVLDATIVNIALPSAQDGPGVLQRLPPVDRHRVRAVLRQPAAARRSHRRPRRAQARLRHRAHRVRRRLRPRRPRRELRRPRRRPRAAGRLRRAARPGGPQPADHHLHDPGGAQQGLRRVRDHRRLRRGGRPDPRRCADRVPELALVHVREPDPRGPGRDRRAAAPRCGAGARRAAADRHPRRDHGVGRPVRPGLRLLQRRDAGMGRAADDRRPGRLRRAARRVRRDRAPRRAPAAAAARRRRPRSRRRLSRRRDRRRGHVRRVPLPHLLHAADPGLRAAEDGPRLPADDGRADADRRDRPDAPGAALRRPPAGDPRHGVRRGRDADLHRRHRRLRLRDVRPAGPDGHGPRPRPGHGARDEHRDPRRRPPRRGRRVRHGQHRPADRRLDRHGVAEHAGRERGARATEPPTARPPT